jgi:hypothetical protein
MMAFYAVFRASAGSPRPMPFMLPGDTPPAARTNGPIGDFAKIFAVSIALLTVFAIGWEIYVGSSAIEFLVQSAPSPMHIGAFEIGVVIAITIALYSARGGYTYVVLADTVQLGIIVIFVAILSYYYIVPVGIGPAASVGREVFLPPLPARDIVLFAVTMVIVSVSDQIQNPGSWLLAKSAGSPTALKRIFAIGISCLSCIWLTILLIHIFSKAELPHGTVTWLAMLDVQSEPCRAIFICGITCLVLASADSILLGSFNLLQDAFRRGTPDAARADQIRKVVFAGYVIIVAVTAFLVSYLMIRNTPDVFFSMLGIGGILCIYTPAFLTYLGGSYLPLKLTRLRLIVLFCCFCLAAVAQFVLALNHQNAAVFPLILSAFALGLASTSDLRLLAGRLSRCFGRGPPV